MFSPVRPQQCSSPARGEIRGVAAAESPWVRSLALEHGTSASDVRISDGAPRASSVTGWLRMSDHFASIADALSLRYRLEQTLQSGIAAHVYLAEERALERRVAVKVLR